jgi:hypothetical protein
MLSPIFGYLLTGAAAGLTAGMIGVGGGVVTVPFLDVLWTRRGASDADAFAVARGTSLAIMVFTSLSAAYGHWRRGKVRLPWAWRAAAGGLAGALGGAVIGTVAPASYSRAAFGILAVWVGYRFFRGRREGDGNERATPVAPGWSLVALGLGVGAFSSFFGVGGGILCVPLLARFHRFSILEAVATSSALIVGMGLAGATFYALLGLVAGAALPGCWGYVDPAATVLVAASSVVFAWAGVALVHRIPGRAVELLFAVYALGIGVKMLAGF